MHTNRMREIAVYSANRAMHAELLPSGLWHHHDIRNNFYDAVYMIAVSYDETCEVPFDRRTAIERAELVLGNVLELQDKTTELKGHWPLNLNPLPSEAKANPLPAELMGLLMVYFFERYGDKLSESLQAKFPKAFQALYEADFYKQPLQHYHHHEAKYTAGKLIYGQLFSDEQLLADGLQSLRDTLARIKQVGMTEYGCLPWFWHWVQAFTAAYELAEQKEIRIALSEMLDYLWQQRTRLYWQGAWVGAHSRGLPHDLPADGNVLFDYVQYGDFAFPTAVPRIEFAGLLYYAAPEQATAELNGRVYPYEIKQQVPPKPEASNYEALHSYVYMEESYAAGGMWERATEFDNEQQRWNITLPATGNGEANRAYFFHPGMYFGGTDSEDWRHQSNIEQVVMDKGAVMSVYPITADDEHQYIVGCLPKGEWLADERALFGKCGQVYVAVYLHQTYKRELREAAWRVISSGASQAVAMEAVSDKAAQSRGIDSLEQFAATMRVNAPTFKMDETEGIIVQAEYTALAGQTLSLQRQNNGQYNRLVNNTNISFAAYSV